MNFEQVDTHVHENFSDVEEAQVNPTQPITYALLFQKLEKVWPVAKPVLQSVLLIPFLPKKWKVTIQTLIDVVDTIQTKGIQYP